MKTTFSAAFAVASQSHKPKQSTRRLSVLPQGLRPALPAGTGQRGGHTAVESILPIPASPAHLRPPSAAACSQSHEARAVLPAVPALRASKLLRRDRSYVDGWGRREQGTLLGQLSTSSLRQQECLWEYDLNPLTRSVKLPVMLFPWSALLLPRPFPHRCRKRSRAWHTQPLPSHVWTCSIYAGQPRP